MTNKTQAGEDEGRCCEKCAVHWKFERGVPTYNFDCEGPPLVAFAEAVSGYVEVDFYVITFPAESNGYKKRMRKKWCLLIVIRIVLWVRFGWACGILASPYLEIYSNAPALAEFFSHQHWPAPQRQRPVLLVGVRASLTTQIKARMETAKADLVKSTELRASRRHTMKGFSVKGFIENSQAYDHTPMVRRAAKIAVDAGMVPSVDAALQRQPHQLPGNLKRILYPS